jgi:hypothetical protein
MRAKHKIQELSPEEAEQKLSKQDKNKLELLSRYTDKDVKEMLAYIANNTKREIDKII